MPGVPEIVASLSGQLLVGDALSGETHAGAASSGEMVAGDTVAGQVRAAVDMAVSLAAPELAVTIRAAAEALAPLAGRRQTVAHAFLVP